MNFHHFTFYLSRGQLRVTDGRTDRWTEGQTDKGDDNPLRPDRPRGKKNVAISLGQDCAVHLPANDTVMSVLFIAMHTIWKWTEKQK